MSEEWLPWTSESNILALHDVENMTRHDKEYQRPSPEWRMIEWLPWTVHFSPCSFPSSRSPLSPLSFLPFVFSLPFLLFLPFILFLPPFPSFFPIFFFSSSLSLYIFSSLTFFSSLPSLLLFPNFLSFPPLLPLKLFNGRTNDRPKLWSIAYWRLFRKKSSI